jgi:hypothetical protein
MFREYIVGIEILEGEEHVVDSTSVDAEDEEEALQTARNLATEWYPFADQVYLQVTGIREIPEEELNGFEI